MKVSLKRDLNINKGAIRKNVDAFIAETSLHDERFETAMRACYLLNAHGDSYELDEALELLNWYITSHDECVWENEDDFHPLQVYAANKKMEKYEFAVNYISDLK